MAVNNVVFADVSSLKIGGAEIEGANSFQASEPAETRPIYTFKKAKPAVILSSQALGSGSFSYVAGDGLNSSLETNWKTLLNGAATITVDGQVLPNVSTVEPGQTVSLTGCQFQNKSAGMNAKNEMVVTVNFSFVDGLNP